MTTQRSYPSSSVDMLTASMIIAQNGKENEEFLSAKRPAWASPYFDNLIAHIEKTSTEVLGIRSVHQLVEASNAMQALRTKVLADIAELKVQIKVDYAAEKQQMELLLNKLGIGNATPDYKKSQQALMQTVEMLQTALTPEFVAQLQEKGIAAPAIQALLSDSKEYARANVAQEQGKLTRSKLSAENEQVLNNLYKTIIGISKIARTFYKGQPQMQAKFSFNKILKNLTGSRTPLPVEEPENLTETSESNK